MKRHPLLLAEKKAEITKLEKLASNAKSKDEYMKLRVQAHMLRRFYGLN